AARERAVLLRIAPYLTLPMPLLVPIYGNRVIGSVTLHVGLWLYEKLGAVKKGDCHRMLSVAETLRQEPLLGRDGLNGAGVYTEYLTDDARLVLETVKSAAHADALVANYAEAGSFLRSAGGICGATVREVFSESDLTVQARVVVNAAGPWVYSVRSLDGEITGKRLHLTKGIHVVVPREKLPLSQIVLLRALDGRRGFAIPRGEMVYVGTTDTDYPRPADRPEITGEDAEYLLEAVNHTFPDAQLRIDDVVAAWAGLRPLLHQAGKSPSEISRRDEILVSPSGLISIAGGKLTTYRRMAERVVDLVGTVLKEKQGKSLPGRSRTADLPLRAEGRGEEGGFADFRRSASSFTQADVLCALEEEMVMTVEDFLDRRTSASLFTPDNGLGALEQVAHTMAAYFGWDSGRTQQEIEAYRTLVRKMKVFARL
ncbi:MAG: glycerol-3-phosphate dehydrogenase/oxidase, partial [Deltaproteobacteria bacterium]|nr:glycerol-3-phosphate dehydrogenase/oxidase [Deltaproteobacteria bacterium]